MSKCLQQKEVYQSAFATFIINKFKRENVEKIKVSELVSKLSFETGGSSETFKRYARSLDGSETPFKVFIDKCENTEYIMLKDGAVLEKLFGINIV